MARGSRRGEVGVFAFGGVRCHIDREATRVFEVSLHHLRRLRPVAVVVLAVDDEDGEFFRGQVCKKRVSH